MRIVELTIDDLIDIAGIEGIALVERPAHEENWKAFNGQDLPIYERLSEDEMGQLARLINELGETEDDLKKDGYKLVKIEELTHQEFIESTPNAPVEPYSQQRIRYKYTGPNPAGRSFCTEMLNANKVFTEQNIQQLSTANPVGPAGYNVLHYRGSYNCRHKWVKLTYVPRDLVGEIVNDASNKRGLLQQNPGTSYDTRTTDTIAAAARGTRKNGQPIQQWRPGTPRVGGFSAVGKMDGVPMFTSPQEAEQLAEILGCKGHHTHQLRDTTLYMPCEKHDFETYNDYPQSARENACKVLRWIDEHGRDEVSGMELTGLQRANSLCSGENISEDTIARMAAFERHRQNSEIAPEFKGTPWKDKGYVAWLAWGGDEGIAWAQRKLKQIRGEEMEIDTAGLSPYVNQTGKTISEEVMIEPNPCQSGYVAYGTKIKNGREVPNCIPVQQSAQFGLHQFSFNDEKMEITGAAIVPNKFIIRYDNFMRPYYVFFSKETTKKLADKFMRDKLTDSTNLEHTDVKAEGTFVSESWIVEDPLNDKSNALGLDYPEGTWVVSMKVQNKELWDDIKKGKYKGYSVEGFFEEKLLFSHEDIVLEQINQILTQTNYDE